MAKNAPIFLNVGNNGDPIVFLKNQLDNGDLHGHCELLNSKNEWHQAKLVRTTTQVIQGGAELLLQQGGGRGGQPLGRRVGDRTQGQ